MIRPGSVAPVAPSTRARLVGPLLFLLLLSPCPPAGAVEHAGLMWSAKVEQPGVIAQCVTDRAWAVFSEAQFFSAPTLTAQARAINPDCLVVASVNAWAVFDNGSIYWPSHARLSAVCDEWDGWLSDVTGAPIRTAWGLRLMDARVPAVRDAWIIETRGLMARSGARALFVDETYPENYVRSRTGRDVPGWDAALARMLRLVAAAAPAGLCINGPLEPGLASISGYYLQRASSRTPSEVRDWIKVRVGATAPTKRLICIEIPTAADAFWQGIAAEFPGVCVQEGPVYDGHPPALILDGVTITVDAVTRRVRVGR